MENKEYDLNEIYDKLCIEGGYFNYPLNIELLKNILIDKKFILELCVGTGNIAIPLSNLGFKVTGIDRDISMLTRLKNKIDYNPSNLIVQKVDDAADFNLDKKFDSIYIHSGHLIFNVRDNKYFLNVISEKSMSTTFNSVANHLNNGGLFVINIERWDDCTIKLSDGTIFHRILFKETDTEGKRLYTFYDGNNGKIHSHEADLQTKFSKDAVVERLSNLGFTDFKFHFETYFTCIYNNIK